MNRKTIVTEILCFENPAELPEETQRLLLEAKNALEKSYSPYSGFSVGAALRLSNGVLLSGANFENASYPLCLCAERVALAAAAAQFPGVPVLSIAITVAYAKKQALQPAAPCGACRQVILEVENKQNHPIKILLQGESETVLEIASGKDLLPLGFDGGWL